MKPRIPSLATRRSMGGVSLVELMIGITLGLLILAGLASVLANTSRSRNDIERTARQIENGRYAMELLGDDIRMAGFYGELAVNSLGITPAIIDPCSSTPADWTSAIPTALQGYDNGASAPSCMPVDYQAGTDVLVVRRVAECQAGVSGCAAAVANQPYLQASKCSTQLATTNTSYVLGLYGTATFDRTIKDCATVAGLRQYFVNIYFLSTNNGQGQNIPTLKRLEFNGAGFNEVTLVEGIEQINFEYGVDWNGDGQPEGWTADPSNYNPAACAGFTCTAAANWSNVVAVRINLLARNTDSTPTYTDTKTYTLGLDATGNPVTYTPNDNYHRHAYNTVVRVVNVSQRRELP